MQLKVGISLIASALCGPASLRAATPPDLRWAEQVLTDVRAASFSDLQGFRIAVRRLESQSDYFQARFRFLDFFYRPHMRYLLFANPAGPARGLPDDGMRAIVAHELTHVEWYAHGNRLRLITLTRLISVRWRGKFERGADTEAVRRGYGAGLKHFRQWQYTHLAPEVVERKKRDYLGPEEIQSLLDKQP